MGESLQVVMDLQRNVGIAAIIGYLAGFVVLDLDESQYIIYGIGAFGLISFTVFLGLSAWTTWNVKFQLKKTIEVSIMIMRWCLEDLRKIQRVITPENREQVLGLLLKGITHIITIPLLTEFVISKIPLIGGLLKKIIKRYLTKLFDTIQYDEKLLEVELNRKEDEEGIIDFYLDALDTLSKTYSQTLSFFMGVTMIPMVGSFVVSLIVLLVFLSILHIA